MSDCKRSEIPEKLIKDKGFFKCGYNACGYNIPASTEYTPSEEDIIAIPIPRNPNTDYSVSGPALASALGSSIVLKNRVFEDEYMSWASDEISVEDAPISDAECNNCYYSAGNGDCNGLFVRGGWEPNNPLGTFNQIFINPPTGKKCGGFVSYPVNSFLGQSVNMGWFGTKIRFFLNIYKVYCCVKNPQGEVIDYDYNYYFTEMHDRDGVLCLDNYGILNCTYCEYFLNDEKKFHIQSDNYLIHSYDIPMKPEELP